MRQISATVITFNEQDNIERCLCSLVGVADEIIVVDSFSTDHTLDICRRYGCHIAQRTFDGYGAQRQYATSLATHSYVLSVDADEVVSEELGRHICRLKTEGFEHRVYQVRILNRFFGRDLRHGKEGNEWRIRLFNKRYAQWNTHNVAERVTVPDNVEPARLEGPVVHYRCVTPHQLRAKELRHALLKAQTMARKNQHVNALQPYTEGLSAYWHAMVDDGGLWDGRVRHTIARIQAQATFKAFKTARKLIKGRAAKSM